MSQHKGKKKDKHFFGLIPFWKVFDDSVSWRLLDSNATLFVTHWRQQQKMYSNWLGSVFLHSFCGRNVRFYCFKVMSKIQIYQLNANFSHSRKFNRLNELIFLGFPCLQNFPHGVFVVSVCISVFSVSFNTFVCLLQSIS